jgi:hypothetical protein
MKTTQIQNVSYSDVRGLLDKSQQLEQECNCFEGVLIDNYIIYDNEKLTVNKKLAKYIIIKETIVNSWTSDYTIILTDDIEKVGEYEKMFES